jgi:hypothetical protein
MERGIQCWRMLVGRGIFRDLWLDERGAGLGVVVFGFKSAFYIFG